MRDNLTVKFWGTRGSIPVAGKQYAKYGGNTTCLEVISDCLPPECRLIIDAGTGIIPFGLSLKKREKEIDLDTGTITSSTSINRGEAKTKKIIVLFTHYHHDHTQGLLMLPQLYDKSIEFQLIGPQENGTGPQEVLKALMNPPLFPVAFAEIASHIRCKGIEHPAGKVIVAHRGTQPTIITLEELERAEKSPEQQIRLGNFRADIKECLVIKMYRSNHPERTISYRFEDRASNRSFVFLTDHENTDGIPSALRRHLAQTNLLVMDAQYTREQYDAFTAGFGHSTPDYCLKIAEEISAGILLLTHHDPGRDDDSINEILGTLVPNDKNLTVNMACDGCYTEL